MNVFDDMSVLIDLVVIEVRAAPSLNKISEIISRDPFGPLLDF